jgi:hypothetical protein
MAHLRDFSATTVTVYTRHKGDCPLKSEPQTKKCKCPKWLYIYTNGKGHRRSNKSTSWKTDEEMAAAERERLRTGTTPAAKEITVDGALQQWLASFKNARSSSTARIYKSYTDEIHRWADANGIQLLQGVTRTHSANGAAIGRREPLLPDGNPRCLEDRFGRTTQSQFTGYLKRLFAWAEGERSIPEDPALHLKGIKPEGAKIVPLNMQQFAHVRSAVEHLRTGAAESLMSGSATSDSW